jgi:hypothetical protein
MHVYRERGPILFSPESSLYVIVPSLYAPVYVDILLFICKKINEIHEYYIGNTCIFIYMYRERARFDLTPNHLYMSLYHPHMSLLHNDNKIQ